MVFVYERKRDNAEYPALISTSADHRDYETFANDTQQRNYWIVGSLSE